MAACFAVAPAFAHPTNDDLAARFAKGAYMEAARIAEQAASADDYAFAARSLLAECMTGSAEPDAGMVEHAKKDAEAALKIDPMHEEGRLQLAIALSLKSRTMNTMDAWNSGYGDKGLKLARSVLAQDPDNYFAHGFLAVWNLEVRRRGGALGASIMGASIADARMHYEAAARLAPDYVGVYWQYARALVALDARKYGDQAKVILQEALDAKADDHVEGVMQERSRVLLNALKGDGKAAQALALRML
jgi:tetratricopeptide (TPR) repeat protein